MMSQSSTESMSTGTPGTVAAHMWLPNHVTKASVYENGLLLGEASTVYDDPGRTFSYDGKRWKYLEFSGRIGTTNRYWVVFR